MLTDAEKASARHFLGYPAADEVPAALCTVSGGVDWRLGTLIPAEAAVARRYLAVLMVLEANVPPHPASSLARPDTDQAERLRAFTHRRMLFCEFLDVTPGPALRPEPPDEATAARWARALDVNKRLVRAYMIHHRIQRDLPWPDVADITAAEAAACGDVVREHDAAQPREGNFRRFHAVVEARRAHLYLAFALLGVLEGENADVVAA